MRPCGVHVMIQQDVTIQILLVEDNPIDVLMISEALKTWKSKYCLHVVQDGEEALEFLFRRGCYGKVERPDLILLDLNLPRRSGTEVLSEIKQCPDLSTITLAIVTTSDASRDIRRCNELGADLYITKPLDFEEYAAAINSIEEFWTTV